MNEQVLKMKIQNIKGIKLLDFEFPLRSGIYAITGENGSGKSTLISCASSVFYQMPMIEFFGRPENASINFMLNEMTRSWECNGKVWTSQSSKNRMNISGFYEGSIIFGNRFKDTNISTINKLDNLTKNDLEPAREFVYKNLGQILKNDEEFYKELFLVKKNSAKNIGLTREAFCIKKAGNQFISQPRMSTGENLLLSILQSLEYVRKRRKKNNEYPCIVF